MNEETIIAARAALADIAGLSVLSKLRENPVIKALTELLETTRRTADELPFAGRSAAVRRNTARRQDNSTRDIPLELCRNWAAFIETCLQTAGNKSLRETINGLAAEIPAIADRQSRLSQTAAAADTARVNRVASFDIVRLGFDIAVYLREHNLPHAAQDIEAEAKALWIIEGATDNPGNRR